MQHVHGAVAAAERGQPVRDRVAGQLGGLPGRLGQRQPGGQAGRQRGRVRAARPVRGRDRVPGDRDGQVRRPSKRWSTGSAPCPPVISTAGAPMAASRSASSARSSVFSWVSACASGRFGVTTVASGNSRPISVSTASSRSSRAPELATMTGSTTSGRPRGASASATASISGAENSMPVLAASAPMSSSTASICARAKAGGTSWMAVTPRVFCAVSATMADMPCAPHRANAFRSAWMPAPPPESDDAMVSTLLIGASGGAGIRLLPSSLGPVRRRAAFGAGRLPALLARSSLVGRSAPCSFGSFTGGPSGRPVSGLDAWACQRREIRPAARASYPAATASRIARAIRSGSAARVMADAISTPAQPSSMANAASLAVPIPRPG